MAYRITTNDTSVLKGKAKANVAYNERKKIKITSRGPLATKGGAFGPIMTPYLETIANIKNLLSRDRATVIEVKEDGTEVKLTLANYCLDNATVKPEVKTEVPKQVETPKPEVKEAEAPSEKTEEVASEKVEETKPTYNEYKKNKNKKNNRNNETETPVVNTTTEE